MRQTLWEVGQLADRALVRDTGRYLDGRFGEAAPDLDALGDYAADEARQAEVDDDGE